MRLDQKVADILGVSRNRAQFFVKNGLVYANDQVVKKPGAEVSEKTEIIINQNHPQIHYVSRSAEKLDAFLDASNISIKDAHCLDIGASTGGFTQVLLERGAKSVVALDVGSSQLHHTLRSHPQIISLEHTDIRAYTPCEKFPIITIDVSFISLREILPKSMSLLSDNGVLIVLFKPQFEVGIEGINKKTGVPKTEQIRLDAIKEFRTWLNHTGISLCFEKESTLSGEAWNREVLFALQKK